MNLGPDRPFDPEKETKDEYEMSASFPILVVGSEENNDERRKQKDRGDSAIVGNLGD